MSQGHRVVIYYVKHFATENPRHEPYGKYIPPTSLATYATHLLVGAIHFFDKPGLPVIALNDDAYDSKIYNEMWEDVAALQLAGVKVMGMLGGAIWPEDRKGDFELLFSNWDTHYPLLKAMIQEHKLQGLDLDPEEGYKLQDPDSPNVGLLKNIERLITALRNDFGPDFIISLAPVARDLQLLEPSNFSGFDYIQLEKDVGHDISFYNVQFYNGWGVLSVKAYNDLVEQKVFSSLKFTAGTLTNPTNGGSGFVPVESGKDEKPSQVSITRELVKEHGAEFGGIVGWQYFNSEPGGEHQPEIWAKLIQAAMKG